MERPADLSANIPTRTTIKPASRISAIRISIRTLVKITLKVTTTLSHGTPKTQRMTRISTKHTRKKTTGEREKVRLYEPKSVSERIQDLSMKFPFLGNGFLMLLPGIAIPIDTDAGESDEDASDVSN